MATESREMTHLPFDLFTRNFIITSVITVTTKIITLKLLYLMLAVKMGDLKNFSMNQNSMS